jgi:anti-repressor protein
MENKNQLQVFNSEEFGQVRVVEINGKPYAIANDVAKALGYKNTSKAINDHCRCITKCYIPHPQSPDKTIEVNAIPEGDIYRLIVKSDLPSSEKFESWLFDEVIPSINKHGIYMTPEVIEKTLSDPDFIIQLATQLKEERIKRIEAEKKIEQDKPLVAFAETCLKSKDNLLVREVSKVAQEQGMDIGEKKLYKKLREWGLVLNYSTEPSQRGMNSGYFVVEEKSVDTAYGVKLTSTTKVTPKGQVFIIEKLKKELHK